MKHPPVFYRFLSCIAVLLFSLICVTIFVHIHQIYRVEAKQTDFPTNQPPLRWLEFPVVTGTVRAINVHKNTILWSHYANLWGFECDDYVPYPPPEQKKDSNPTQTPHIPEEVWAICLYNSLDGSLKMLESAGDLNYPDMYGDWVVMDRNLYIGTLRAENIVTGEERDIWYKAYEERTLPRIHQETVISSPDNKSLVAYNLATNVFTNVAYIPDYPDLWTLAGHIYENIVVWDQTTNRNMDLGIIGFDLTTQQPFTVTDLPGHEVLYGIDNNHVYWGRDGTIYWKNLLTGEEFTLEPMGNQRSVRISGEWIVWTDDRHGAPSLWDVYVYNLVTEQEYRITQESDRIDWLGFDGNLVAWGITTDQGTRIRAAKLLSYAAFLPLLQR